jgi:hypothetical protein
MRPRDREKLLQQLAEDDGRAKESSGRRMVRVTPVDGVPDVYVRRQPTGPVVQQLGQDPDPLVGIVRALRNIRWAIAALVIPLIAFGKIAVTQLYDRVETSTLEKIERARLLDDVAELKRRNEAQAKIIRDAEEELRRVGRQLQNLLGDKPPPWRPQ